MARTACRFRRAGIMCGGSYARGSCLRGSYTPGSCARSHEAHEDLLERALARVEVLEVDALLAEPVQEVGDAGLAACGIEGIDQLVPAGRELDRLCGERRRNAGERPFQMQGQALAAELPHQGGFLLDEDHLALVDDADAVGHLLGLLDVV